MFYKNEYEMITSGKSDVKWSRLVFVAIFFCLVPAVWCLFGSFWMPSKHQSESSSISVRAGVIVLELKWSQIFKGRWWRPNVWPLEKNVSLCSHRCEPDPAARKAGGSLPRPPQQRDHPLRLRDHAVRLGLLVPHHPRCRSGAVLGKVEQR